MKPINQVGPVILSPRLQFGLQYVEARLSRLARIAQINRDTAIRKSQRASERIARRRRELSEPRS